MYGFIHLIKAVFSPCNLFPSENLYFCIRQVVYDTAFQLEVFVCIGQVVYDTAFLLKVFVL